MHAIMVRFTVFYFVNQATNIPKTMNFLFQTVCDNTKTIQNCKFENLGFIVLDSVKKIRIYSRNHILIWTSLPLVKPKFQTDIGRHLHKSFHRS